MGITEILTIIFVVLKLLGKIQWSWILVLLPEIIGFVIYVTVAVIHLRAVHSAGKAIIKEFRDW